MPLCGGTIPLAPGPGPLVRFAFHVKSSRQGSHPQLSRLKRDASADWATGGCGIPGRSCTFDPPVRSRLLSAAELRGHEKWRTEEGLHPAAVRLSSAFETVPARLSGTLPVRWRLPEELHPMPRRGTIRFQDGPGALVPLVSHA